MKGFLDDIWVRRNGSEREMQWLLEAVGTAYNDAFCMVSSLMFDESAGFCQVEGFDVVAIRGDGVLVVILGLMGLWW